MLALNSLPMDQNQSLPAVVTSVRYLVTRWGQEAVRHSSAMPQHTFLPAGCQPFHFVTTHSLQLSSSAPSRQYGICTFPEANTSRWSLSNTNQHRMGLKHFVNHKLWLRRPKSMERCPHCAQVLQLAVCCDRYGSWLEMKTSISQNSRTRIDV